MCCSQVVGCFSCALVGLVGRKGEVAGSGQVLALAHLEPKLGHSGLSLEKAVVITDQK